MKISRRSFIIGSMGAALASCAATNRLTPEIGVRRTVARTVPECCHGSGLRLALVSDLHAGFHLEPEILPATLNILTRLRPDLILFAGDFVEKDVSELDVCAEFLHQAGTIAPCVGVLGNHDVWAGASRMTKRLAQCGVYILRDQSRSYLLRGLRLRVSGARDLEQESGPWCSCLSENADGELRILLTHNPDMLLHRPADAPLPHIMLAGHTHGGQICTPWGTPILTTADRRFITGLSTHDGVDCIVSAGLGYTNIPLRVNCPPDLTIVDMPA